MRASSVHTLLVSAGLCLLAGMAGGAAPPASALRGELEARVQSGQDSRSEAETLTEQIGQLKGKLSALDHVSVSANGQVQGEPARLIAIDARQAALDSQAGAEQTRLARILGALELYRRDPPPALLVSPHSARDAVRAAILMQAIEPELAARAREIAKRSAELALLRRQAGAANADRFITESDLADSRARLEHLISDKEALRTRILSDADANDSQVGAIISRLRSSGGGVDVSGRSGPPSLAPPVAGLVIRRYGQPIEDAPPAQGVTWRTPSGAQVRAPAAGVVEYSGDLKGWGGLLIIGLGGGYHLVLSGLERMTVPQGKGVAAGQPLGVMATTATPELYLELRHDGATVDPEHMLRPLALAQAGGR